MRRCLALLLVLAACHSHSDVAPLADIGPQDSIVVWAEDPTKDSVPFRTVVDTSQIAAILTILQVPAEWHYEFGLPNGEHRLALNERNGRRLNVQFCPRSIVARTGEDRVTRSISTVTYDSLLQLTWSHPVAYGGDTATAHRERQCHLRMDSGPEAQFLWLFLLLTPLVVIAYHMIAGRIQAFRRRKAA